MKPLRLLTMLAIAILPVSAQAAEAGYSPLVRSLADTVILPAYQRFEDGMTVLATETAAYCAAPSPATRQAVETAFAAGMDAWQEVQPIDFGPVTENSRYSRIQFWPDKGGTAARHMRQALQNRDPGLTQPGGLTGRSVALQNLAAYEGLLFVSLRDGPQIDPYACALATSIARFQATQARAILDDWRGPYQSVLADPAKATELATAMFKAIFTTLDRIIGQKLEPPLGKSLAAAQPKRSESWRSGHSLANIAANLRMAERLYSSRDSFADRLAAGGSEAMATGLRRTFEEQIAAAGAIGMPLFAAVVDAAARQKLEKLLADIKDLRILMAGPVAEDLKLVIGFNAQDGD